MARNLSKNENGNINRDRCFKVCKIVEWSDEDGMFVGQCPGVIGRCCHGFDETEVDRELRQIVEEWVELM